MLYIEANEHTGTGKLERAIMHLYIVGTIVSSTSNTPPSSRDSGSKKNDGLQISIHIPILADSFYSDTL